MVVRHHGIGVQLDSKDDRKLAEHVVGPLLALEGAQKRRLVKNFIA